MLVSPPVARLLLACVLPVIAACGGSTVSPAGGADSGGGGPDAHPGSDGAAPADAGTTGDSSSPADAGRAPQCPDALPAQGSPCTPQLPPGGGLWECEYGPTHCTTIATCSGSGAGSQFTWYLQGPDPSCNGNPHSCPGSIDAGAGAGACNPGTTCTYPDGRCSCTACTTDAGAHASEWSCSPWLVPSGCPEPPPLLGTACATEGQECDYGPVCCGTVDVGSAMTCQNGYWAIRGAGCDCISPVCGGP